MQIKILSFGLLSELISSEIVIKDVADSDVLKQKLEECFPLLQNIQYAISIDRKIINNNTAINESSIVAILPPFSGG